MNLNSFANFKEVNASVIEASAESASNLFYSE